MKTKKRRNKLKAIISALTASLMMSAVTISASAADVVQPQQLAKFTKVTKWINDITSEFKTVGYAIAGLCVIILGVIFMTAGQEGLGKGKRMAVAIVVGICVISFGTSIVTDLKSA